ncbi:MAG: hypothetical protein QNJ55_22270 [Xenococcus sp. MO_188.B8]|nr:hypothetical protein [Xenococcus sp. MO_188.B8]
MPLDPLNPPSFVVSNHNQGVNIDTRNSDTRLSIVIDEPGNDAIYASDESDIIATGPGNDIVHGGGGDDLIEGGDGNDFIRGGAGNDDIIGGKGADVIIGGTGADTYFIQGDPVGGAFGPNSDLVDAQGNVVIDQILDFDDAEDLLFLQDLGSGSVDYNENTGEVTLDDTTIAKLPAGLEDVEINNLGGGNWTLM